MGNNERGCVCLEALLNRGHKMVGVVALPDDRQPKWSRNVAALAKGFKLATFQPSNVNALDFAGTLRKLEPELIVLAGYNQLLHPHVFEIPTLMCINLHASPLPYYRGAAPLNWMLINGESRGGMSILEVDDGVDTGDILAQEFFEIGPNDTYSDLLQLILQRYPPLLVSTVESHENGTIKRTKQNREEGSFYTRRYPKDGCIDCKKMNSVQIHNLVRALVYPMPGSFITLNGRRIIVEGTRIIEREYRGVAGRVAAHWESGVVVVCKDRGILVTACRGDDGSLIEARAVLPKTGEDVE